MKMEKISIKVFWIWFGFLATHAGGVFVTIAHSIINNTMEDDPVCSIYNVVMASSFINFGLFGIYTAVLLVKLKLKEI